jgi:gamma-glutamyltranspeptidase/glutathione hydrolase
MAIGSAGATRIRTAMIHTLTNVLIHGDDMTTAIRRPRFHPVSADGARLVHLEPGCDPSPFTGLAVQHWDRLDHYFGGVSAVGLAGAAGDPRRGGVGRLL